MKMWTRHVACALLAVMSVGAQAAGDQGTQLTTWERFKSYAHNEKDVAVKEGQKLIAATDKQLEEMKQQAKDAKKEALAAHKASMAELEAKKKAAQAELDKMGRSTSTAWEATKDGFANAYKDLHQAYGKAKASARK
jgi:hypothetical protein